MGGSETRPFLSGSISLHGCLVWYGWDKSHLRQTLLRTEKSVFISYRRTNFPWAMAIYQALRADGFDVFIDYSGIKAGDFESVLLENVRTRSHFVVLLTPSALERCGEPGDWFRREIEEAMATQRNVVPVMLEGFDFSTQAIAKQLTGKLETLKRYQAMSAPNEYFEAAMEKLRKRLHETVLESVTHPPSPVAALAAAEQEAAAKDAVQAPENELLAQQYFERALASADLEEKVRLYTEAIALKPDYSYAYNNRGNSRAAQGDRGGAIADYGEAIRLKPQMQRRITTGALLVLIKAMLAVQSWTTVKRSA